MRTVHSYALMQFQLWWPDLTKDIPDVNGWDYVVMTTYLMECAKRGIYSASPQRQHELVEILRERYPDVLFEKRQGVFILILNSVGISRISHIVKKLRDEMVDITHGKNLVWMGVTYAPIDLVRCRYHFNPIEPLRMAL